MPSIIHQYRTLIFYPMSCGSVPLKRKVQFRNNPLYSPNHLETTLWDYRISFQLEMVKMHRGVREGMKQYTTTKLYRT